jgi:uncharacterized protein YuzE
VRRRVSGDPAVVTWDDDTDADVLYLAIGEPQPAIGIDVGDGVMVRYNEERQEVVEFPSSDYVQVSSSYLMRQVKRECLHAADEKASL